MNADAVTIAPYMGSDSVRPFYSYEDKWIIILGLTSNEGSKDFQLLNCGGEYLYEKVIEKINSWGSKNNTMCVVGATHPEAFAKIRLILPDQFLLVPGVGAQGGDLEAVYEYGKTDDVGIIVNSTRSIIYAGGRSEDYLEGVKESARAYQQQMKVLLT